MQGWGLIVRACTRLGIWDNIAGQLLCREFALACRKICPGLDPYLRAESYKNDSGTLLIRSVNSAALNDLQYVKDILLSEMNSRIERIARNIRKHRENARLPVPPPIRDFQFSIGPLRGLPDANYWTTFPKRSIILVKPAQRVNVDVIDAIGKVQNTELRQQLRSLYSSAIAGSNLPIS